MVDADELLPYGEIMARIGELADGLLSEATPDIRVRLEELLDLVDAYHRRGLERLLGMILAWRGEIFLESVARDDVAGRFISTSDGDDSQ
ncbi:MAG: hypothetical protein M3Y04_03415 [Actinomycetota bacterium]|nr:hypothetical protein [Actinomycetota bacterium]